MTAEEIERVNRALYRPLKSGREFEAVMPSFKKIVYNFDKRTDNHNTFKTLEFMEQWANKYAFQCAKLAKLLQGKTVQETCNNIYNFLYNNFQYKLDGEAQDLRALSAAWYDRSKGMDCKSFSLLAKMILDNLNIKAAFRMVQIGQPIWSHVYVVVPDGNKYHVIDATTHDNREVRFTQKYDRIMYHRGLASPIQMKGLGCSCQGQSLAKSGLGNPGTLEQSIKNFHTYLDQLEQKGISRNITNTMLEIVKSNVQRGIDPNMNEVFQRAVSMNRQQGLGFDFGSTINTGIAAYSGDPKAIQSLLTSIIPTSFIGSTFGQVFANGFNLSCWNASLPPSEVKLDIEKHHKPYFNALVSKIQQATTVTQQQDSVNRFIRDVYIMQSHYKDYLIKERDWSSCSKEGIQLWIKFMDALKLKADALIAEMAIKGAKVTMTTVSPVTLTLTQDLTGVANKVYGKNNPATSTVTVPVLSLYTFSAANSSGSSTNQNLVFTPNANGTVVIKDTNTGESATITKEEAIANGYDPENNNNPKIPEKSSNAGLWIAGGLLLLKLAL